ncbi:hypothetical protein D3C85_1882210 [compost metagenome]
MEVNLTQQRQAVVDQAARIEVTVAVIAVDRVWQATCRIDWAIDQFTGLALGTHRGAIAEG